VRPRAGGALHRAARSLAHRSAHAALQPARLPAARRDARAAPAPHAPAVVAAVRRRRWLKAINDESGHLAGDRALRACGRALRNALRDSDIVARFGGDEFAAVALDVAPGAALVLLPRIAQMLEKQSSVLGLPRPLTMSVGAAPFVRGGSTLEDVMERADRAMYREKRRRRSALVDGSAAPDAPPDAA
jgi:diguanylate cyclase (GGDEF)-like protein